MAIWDLIKAGGMTMLVLLGCSVLSIAIIIERCIYYRRRSRTKRAEFMKLVSKELDNTNIGRALGVCKDIDTPFSSVVYSGLILHGHNEVVISNAMEREIVVETTKLEKYITVVGTIGSTAVYIGLFGTVLGIIRAFHDISASGTGGISVVIDGISEALVCTASGLCVAVPAVIAYNYFVNQIKVQASAMDDFSSRFIDYMEREAAKRFL